LAGRFKSCALCFLRGGDLSRFIGAPALGLFPGRSLSRFLRGRALSYADLPGGGDGLSGSLALREFRSAEPGAVAFHRLLPRFRGSLLSIGYGWRSQFSSVQSSGKVNTDRNICR
jgi:hypothetical protein